MHLSDGRQCFKAEKQAFADLRRDMRDARAGRAAARPGDEGGDCRGLAADHSFDGGVAAIPYPAGNAQALCLVHHAVTVTHALHVAADNEVADFHGVYLPLIAVSMPVNSACGVGGQPGTATSTGMMLATRPQLA